MNSFVSSCHHTPAHAIKCDKTGLTSFYCYVCGEKCYLVAPLWIDKDELKLLDRLLRRVGSPNLDMAIELSNRITQILNERAS